MKLRIMSDVHLEFSKFRPKSAGEDVVVLAGDVGPGNSGVAWAARYFPGCPVIYVPGNHEFYNRPINRTLTKLHAFTAAHAPNIHVLSDDAVVIDGVRFLGATLWTDFNLFGDPEGGMGVARDEMNDYRRILAERPADANEARYGRYRARLQPDHVLALHERSLGWLRTQMAEPFAGQTVIVTHHAPSLRSVPAARHDDPASVAYASPLDAFVADSGAALWIHGHIHAPQDYWIGATRVYANPRGYPFNPCRKGFEEDRLITVGACSVITGSTESVAS
ncbi:MAG TPA: metallophosphoesterase [Gammaproteobacteria bacterium]|nr:metallophosphoesterase [Gammaproteobacteria bacterium]